MPLCCEITSITTIINYRHYYWILEFPEARSIFSSLIIVLTCTTVKTSGDRHRPQIKVFDYFLGAPK